MSERISRYPITPLPYDEAFFDGYQAAPLRIVGAAQSGAVRRRQDLLGVTFARVARHELGDYVKPRTVDFVIHSIISRMQQREALNSISYQHRLHQEPVLELAPEGMSMTAIKQACVRARNGGATPFQNDVNRRVAGMGTAEVANLTMIGDQRRYLEEPMWDAISELVDTDARPSVDDMYGVRIMGFDRNIHRAQHIGAMRINMKRFIGHTDDGATMKARTTAIINTSPSSGFDQSVIEAFREAGSYAEMEQLPEFKRAVHWLVESELPNGLVLARNETVYEEHLETQAMIAEQRNYGLAA